MEHLVNDTTVKYTLTGVLEPVMLLFGVQIWLCANYLYFKKYLLEAFILYQLLSFDKIKTTKQSVCQSEDARDKEVHQLLSEPVSGELGIHRLHTLQRDKPSYPSLENSLI